MKKIIITIIIILVGILLFIKFVPTGYEINKEGLNNIEVPKFSFLEEECCMFSSKFNSLKSYVTLKYELDNMVKKYEKKTCRGVTYYYDKERDITITDYDVELGFPFNQYYITYSEGIYPENCEN